MAAGGLLPVGTVTFLVSDSGEEVFAAPNDALSAALSRRGGAGGAVRIAVTTGDARRRADGNYVEIAHAALPRQLRTLARASGGPGGDVAPGLPRGVGPHDEPRTAGGRGRGRLASPFAHR